jgi:hypothetical protein
LEFGANLLQRFFIERLPIQQKLGAPLQHGLIFDEAERLSMNAVEFIRSVFDRKNIDVLLIGMPGKKKRLSRFPQFYSRVGFAHHYRPS